MNFIEAIKNHVATRESQIEAKRKALEDQSILLVGKEKEIAANEAEYKANFDEAVFFKLKGLKQEKEKIMYAIDGYKEQLALMDVGVMAYPDKELKFEIDAYITRELKLKEALLAIDKGKAEYLGKVNNYLALVSQLRDTRKELDSLGAYITGESKAAMTAALRLHHNTITRYETQGNGNIFAIHETQGAGLELKSMVEVIYGTVK